MINIPTHYVGGIVYKSVATNMLVTGS